MAGRSRDPERLLTLKPSSRKIGTPMFCNFASQTTSNRSKCPANLLLKSATDCDHFASGRPTHRDIAVLRSVATTEQKPPISRSRRRFGPLAPQGRASTLRMSGFLIRGVRARADDKDARTETVDLVRLEPLKGRGEVSIVNLKAERVLF